MYLAMNLRRASSTTSGRVEANVAGQGHGGTTNLVRELSIADLGFSHAELERGDRDLGDLEVILEALGIEVRWFAQKHMLRGSVQLSPETLVMGGLPSIRAALRTMDRSMPDPDDYPSSLFPFLRRRLWPSTLGRGRRCYRAEPSIDL